LALILIAFLFLTRIFKKVLYFLASAPLAVVLMAFMALWGLAMGLIPQLDPSAPAPETIWGILGFFQITSSWAFSFLYLLVLVSLGATVIRLSPKRITVFFSHLGLWLVLLAAGLGAADRQREIMRVMEGSFEWRALDEGKRAEGAYKDLDLAIRLDDFIMEEYPARIALFDPKTGRSWPENKPPVLLQIDQAALHKTQKLGDYAIKVLEYLPNAAPMGDNRFIRVMFQGSVQAALVEAKNLKTGQTFQGWLTPGGGRLPPNPLILEKDGLVLAMTRPEPRSFVSKVKIFTIEGQEVESSVSVNHPLAAGDWLIYQRDYDAEAGAFSLWSGFELIKDPWLNLAYAGFGLWALGCVGLIVKGGPRKP
jgi:hypothetical protein